MLLGRAANEMHSVVSRVMVSVLGMESSFV